MTETPVIRVGTGIIMLNKAGQFLIGKRKNTHGEGTWALPGGTLDHGETSEENAKREALEETGLHITNFEVLTVDEHFFPGGKHFIAILCISTIKDDAEPQLMEPHKCEGWQFFDDWNDLPTPHFVDYSCVKPSMITDYCQRHGLGTHF